ncbi:SERTA domain-containing protein 3 [Paramarasmius palmivorus]|uniref:SERTA domain-containing protein 3 n=1 Tax=Paramarasmius palmivorus TaxID=297713 RepID=A0AAW0BE48_9AGAR
MVQPRAFTGSRQVFLDSHADAYAEAAKENRVKSFIGDLTRRYLKRYPPSLPHDQEPTQESLDAVDDDAPDPETVRPVRQDFKSDEEFQCASKQHEEERKIVLLRMGQIERSMKYQYDKSRGVKGKDNQFAKLLSQLSGEPTTEPKRRKRAYDLWAQDNRKVVEELVQKRLKELKESGEAEELDLAQGNVGKDGDEADEGNLEDEDDESEESKEKGAKKKGKAKHVKKGKRAFVRVRQEVVKRAFDALPEDKRLHYEEASKTDFEDRLKAYQECQKAGVSTEPQARQDAINRLPAFVQPILDGIVATTGMHCTLLVGGPEPADMGRLNVVGFSSGRTLSNPALTFGEACEEGYRRYVIPLYGSYLRKCFTVQECKSRALPTPGLLSLSGLLAGEEGCSLHPIETPGIPREEGDPSTSKDQSAPSPLPPIQQKAPNVTEGDEPSGTSTAVPTLEVPAQASVSTNPPERRPQPEAVSPLASPSIPQSTSTLAVSFSPPHTPPSSPKHDDNSLPPTPLGGSSPPASLPPTPIRSSPVAASSSPIYIRSPTSSIATKDLGLEELCSEQDSPVPQPITQPKQGAKRGRVSDDALDGGPEPKRARARAVPEGKSKPKRPSAGSPKAPSASISAKASSSSRAKARPSNKGKTPASARPLPSLSSGEQITPSQVASTSAKTGSAKRVAEKVDSGRGKRQKHSTEPCSSVPACPDGAPDYISSLLKLVGKAGLSGALQRALDRYLILEREAGYKGGGLSTTNRPPEVSMWYKRRRACWNPELEDLERFGREFKGWFQACSPPWRVPKKAGTAMVKKQSGDWDCMRVMGPNGIVSFLVCLCWWKLAIGNTGQGEEAFSAALDEVVYTFTSL